MSTHYLGNHFDIHGGGMDLQFPHHENEIAQSEAFSGEKYVNYWIHNGFITINKEKMSKSLKNVYTIRTALKDHHPEVLRFFILSSHYRSPLIYSDYQLIETNKILTSLYLSIRGVKIENDQTVIPSYIEAFKKAMDNDFNTPVAISILFDISKQINKHIKYEVVPLVNTLKYLGGILGILQDNPDDFLEGNISNNDIEIKIQERIIAKNNKDYILADKIRNDLKNDGAILEDCSDGLTMWRKI